MTTRRAAALLRTELRLLASRGAARAVLLVALFVGVGAVLAAWRVHAWGAAGPRFNGQSVSELVQLDGAVVSGWALRARNFFVLPMLLVLATAAGFAGDREDRTLRDTLLQPMAREALLAARLGALGILAALSLVATLVPSVALGLAAFGLPHDPADLGALGLGYAASLPSDVALVLAAATLSLWLRGTGSVVVALLLLLAADAGVRGACAVLGMLGVHGTEQVANLTFARALGAWEGWNGSWDLGAMVALAGWIAGLGLLVARRFRTLDVC
ncbi:MAG: hypothetical protein RLZZ299_897 [Pseudomonadota bacterium]